MPGWTKRLFFLLLFSFILSSIELNDFLMALLSIPSIKKNAFRSEGFLISSGSWANDAIAVPTLYFLQSLMFCIILPMITALLCPCDNSTELKSKHIILSFCFARLHSTWFRPDLFCVIESLSFVLSMPYIRSAFLPSIHCLGSVVFITRISGIIFFISEEAV